MDSENASCVGLLSGDDMVKHHTEIYELHSKFNRLVSLEELDEPRREDLAQMKDQLHRLLLQERVNKSESISEGVWENDKRRIRIIQVEGKWLSYGYEDSTGKFLECYEALFLMEMNRLLVKWNGIVVSIEQAYSLFLGQPGSLTLEEYQVYSILNRSSYYVLRYNPTRKYHTPVSDSLSAEERCVWGNLYDMLNQPNPRETFSTKVDAKLYESVRRSMEDFKNMISKPSMSNYEQTFAHCSSEPIPKKQKFDCSASSDHYDGFKMIAQFRRMFNRFDIVRSLTEEKNHLTPFVENVEPTFDLFAPELHTFKKSLPPLPLARIFVRRSSETMLHFKQLYTFYQQQIHSIPVMLMLISDALTVHCFLYDMRQVPYNVIVLQDDSSASKRNRPK
ncbi:uncharacterized protein LOC128724631 [Anopheles nili]|uniref:uncharacterized protein LOC128724631 n=1 Tax=Anopheles nili TaxID=185578 RepID=UPI00237B0E5E|nr:uncharacterized protein LOC128724631 [Anopheles nili]